jgi:hypothetical protein
MRCELLKVFPPKKRVSSDMFPTILEKNVSVTSPKGGIKRGRLAYAVSEQKLGQSVWQPLGRTGCGRKDSLLQDGVEKQ